MSNEELFNLRKVPFPPYDGDEPFIYVSYAHKDSHEVYQIIHRLHKERFNIFYDEGLVPNEMYVDCIVNRIENCSLFIVFITENSLKSDFVAKELRFAIEEQIPILPIFLENVELRSRFKLYLSTIQSILRFEYDTEEAFISDCIRFILQFVPQDDSSIINSATIFGSDDDWRKE